MSVWNQQRDGGRDGWMRWVKEGRREGERLTTLLGAEGIWTEPFPKCSVLLDSMGEQEHLLGGGLQSLYSLSKEPITQGGRQSQCGKGRVKKRGEGHQEGFSEKGADLHV